MLDSPCDSPSQALTQDRAQTAALGAASGLIGTSDAYSDLGHMQERHPVRGPALLVQLLSLHHFSSSPEGKHAKRARSLAGVQEEQAACSVQGDAPRHAGVGHGPASGQLLAVPPKAAVHVLRDGVEQVAILHVLLNQDCLPNLQDGGIPSAVQMD